MSKFTLTINLGNEAMRGKDDIATLLRLVSNELNIEDEPYIGEKRNVYDINGNTVGSWQVK